MTYSPLQQRSFTAHSYSCQCASLFVEGGLYRSKRESLLMLQKQAKRRIKRERKVSMEQDNLTEKQANQGRLENVSEAASDDSMHDERLKAAGATPERAGRGRSLFGGIRARLMAVES